MSGKVLTKEEDRGQVKEQGHAEEFQRRRVVEESFKEDLRGDSSTTKSRRTACNCSFKQTGNSESFSHK